MPKIVELDIHDPSTQQDILELQRSAYTLEEQLIGFPIPRVNDTAADLTGSDEIFIGMVQDGILLGMLAFSPEENALDIQRVAVNPGYLRQGVASDLIRFIFDAAADFSRFTVTAGMKNTPAVRLYEKMGFREFRTVEPEPGLIMLRMEYVRAVNTA